MNIVLFMMALALRSTFATFGNWEQGRCLQLGAKEVWVNHVGGPFAITLDQCEAFCVESAQFFENYSQKDNTTGLHSTDEDFVYACYWVTRGDVFFNTTTCMTHIGTGN
jgi:hypothetical protein